MTKVCSYLSLLLLTLILIPVSASAVTGFSVRSDEGDDLFMIDLETGDATPIGPTGFGDIECLTFNLEGDTLYGVNDDGDGLLVTCSPETGACSEVGSLGVEAGECGIAFDCDGNLFVSSGGGGEEAVFYSVNPETGQATEIGFQGLNVRGLTARLGDDLCPSGVFGLGVTSDTPDASLGCMDLVTGEYQEIGPLINEELFCGGIDFDANGEVLWGINDGEEGLSPDIFTIDPETGEATVITQTLDGFESLAIAPPFCEEPQITEIPTLSEWGLIAMAAILGIVGLIFANRRRKAAA